MLVPIRQFEKGVLGQQFLSHFDYFLDMRGKQLEFGRHDAGGNGNWICEVARGGQATCAK
jgi:hypothetical protein